MLVHVGAYSAYATPPGEVPALRFVDLVQIQKLGLLNHLARRDPAQPLEVFPLSLENQRKIKEAQWPGARA
jgi:hypothetical protein